MSKTTSPARTRKSARPRAENRPDLADGGSVDGMVDGVDCTIHIGSGNVFADVGYLDAEEREAKADISIRIQELIKRNGLTQEQAALRMGVTQPEVSLIVRGRLRTFKIDRLIRCAQALGQDVQINLPWNDKERAGVTVVGGAADQPRGLLQVISEDIAWLESAKPQRTSRPRSLRAVNPDASKTISL